MATELELEHIEFYSLLQRRFYLSTFFLSNWNNTFQLISQHGSMFPNQTLLHAIYRYYHI